MEFQDMAASIIHRADRTLHLKDLQPYGILASQTRWKSRMPEADYTTSSSTLDLLLPQFGSTEAHSSTDEANPSFNVEFEFPGPELEQVNRHPSEDLDWILQYTNHVLILLMAGAIFPIVVAFLSGKFCKRLSKGVTAILDH
jgi:hypothetical protein